MQLWDRNGKICQYCDQFNQEDWAQCPWCRNCLKVKCVNPITISSLPAENDSYAAPRQNKRIFFWKRCVGGQQSAESLRTRCFVPSPGGSLRAWLRLRFALTHSAWGVGLRCEFCRTVWGSTTVDASSKPKVAFRHKFFFLVFLTPTPPMSFLLPYTPVFVTNNYGDLILWPDGCIIQYLICLKTE